MSALLARSHDANRRGTRRRERRCRDCGTAPPLEVKVLIINMFSLEAAPWLDALRPTQEIRVPGLSSDYPS
jgi:purine nucleoside permease